MLGTAQRVRVCVCNVELGPRAVKHSSSAFVLAAGISAGFSMSERTTPHSAGARIPTKTRSPELGLGAVPRS